MNKHYKWILIAAAAALFQNTKAQNALDFDGTDDKVDCGNDTSVQITGSAITLEAWIYPTAWKTNVYDGNVICKEDNTSNYGYMLRVGAGGKLNFAIGDGKWNEITTAVILSLNSWQHIAGTYDGTKMRVYLNGNAVDSMTLATSIKNAPTTNVTLGAHTTYVRFYQGLMDEVRIWKVCRKSAEIKADLYDEICTRNLKLRAYYKFNQGKQGGINTSVKTLTDFSGYNNTGTLTSFALTGSSSNWLKGQLMKKAVSNGKDTVAACDKFFSPSGKFKWIVSGVYTDTIPTIMGCDSAITIYLTIKKSTTKTLVAYACVSYVSPSGIYTWTKSGTYIDYLRNAQNCDSIITVVLKIGGSRDTIAPVECESYTSPSGKSVHTQSGYYSDTLINFRGCDSVIAIDLTILGPTYATINKNICVSYTSPSGKYVYTQKGKYYDTITNYRGCDSLLTINVEIKTSSSSIKRTACYQWTSPSGKYTWTKSGIYRDTIANHASCDSAITVDLTINNATYNTIHPTSCRSYRSPDKKQLWTVSGIYKDTLINKVGCDSIITVDLTIIKVNVGVQQTSAVLTAASTTGTYQWLNCTLFKIQVTGETNRVFQAKVNADYAVDVTENGCRDTSACFTVVSASTGAIKPISVFSVFPNPNKGSFDIELPLECSNVTVLVRDITGKVVYEKLHEKLLRSSLQLDNGPGIYVVEIRSALFNAGQFVLVER